MLAGALDIRTGVPESLALAGLATGNAGVQAAAARAAASVGEGRRISDALRDCGRIFPATLVWMLSLGEARGDVTGALGEYARLQEEAADRLARTIPTVVATAATLMAAAVLLSTVLAVMLPLLSIFFLTMRLG
jgi:type II secretory pathway component PulF